MSATRLALISDIHGHATALEAVLADIRNQGVSQIICLGDVATIGPHPRRVLDILQDLHCPCILGNHDAAVLRPQTAAANQIHPQLTEALHWCAGQLTATDLDFLRAFQFTLEIALGPGANLLCFHGSPHANTELIVATTPPADLDRLLAGHTATVMAGGHSHLQMLRQHQGTLIVNPGSVGSPFHTLPGPDSPPRILPWAEYALLSWDNGVLGVDLRRVPFDIPAFHASLAHSDSPLRAMWLTEYRA